MQRHAVAPRSVLHGLNTRQCFPTTPGKSIYIYNRFVYPHFQQSLCFHSLPLSLLTSFKSKHLAASSRRIRRLHRYCTSSSRSCCIYCGCTSTSGTSQDKTTGSPRTCSVSTSRLLVVAIHSARRLRRVDRDAVHDRVAVVDGHFD